MSLNISHGPELAGCTVGNNRDGDNNKPTGMKKVFTCFELCQRLSKVLLVVPECVCKCM